MNSLTGGIGSKGKWVAKVGAWVSGQALEVAAETAYDVGWKGRDLQQSLIRNTAGSIGGQALGTIIGVGARSAYRLARNNLEVKPGVMTGETLFVSPWPFRFKKAGHSSCVR